MALDPTLSLQAGQGVTPIAQPMDLMGKAMSLQGGMLQLQQQKMAMQDEQTMRRLAATGQYKTPDELANAAAESGVSPKTVMALKMQGADYQSKVASTAQALATAAQRGGAAQKTKIDLINEQAQKARALALTATDTASYQAGLAQLDQQYAQLGVPSLLQKYGDDTPANRALLATNGATLNDAHAAAFGQTMSTPTGLVNVKQPLVPGVGPTVTPLTQTPVSDLGKLAKDMGLPPNDPRVTAKFKELHPNILYATGGVGAAPGKATPMGPGGQISPDNPALQGLDQGTAELVKKYATYQLPMNPRFAADPRNRAIMSRIMMLNPNFNEADSQAAYKFIKDLSSSSPTSAGGQVQAMNNAFEHLGSMAAIAPQMAGSNFPFFNKMSNLASRETGGTAPVQWDTAAHLLSAEVQKMIKGGMATEGETKQLLDNLSGSASLDQKKAVLGELAEFMYGKIRSFEARRASLLGAMDPGTSFLTPSAQKNLVNVFKMAGKPIPDDLLPAQSAAPITAKPTAPTPQTSPSAKVMSLADAKATAAASGKTLDQVIQAAKAKGWRVQ